MKEHSIDQISSGSDLERVHTGIHSSHTLPLAFFNGPSCGKSEEQLLKKTCRPTVGRLLANCRPTVGQLLVTCR